MKIRTLLVAISVLTVLAPSAAVAAVAAEPTGEVCTVGSLGIPYNEELPDELPMVMSCFDSVREAEQFVKAGAPGDLEQLAPGMELTRAAAATVIIGRVWTGESRTGSELIHWGTGTGCNGVTYGFPTLPSGWNNNIRSAQGYSNCWASHYDGTSYTGQVLTCTPYCAVMGTLAASSSSIVYRPTGTFG